MRLGRFGFLRPPGEDTQPPWERFIEAHLRGYERATFLSLLLGAFAAAAGGVVVAVDGPVLMAWGVALTSGGLGLLCLAVALSRPLQRFRTIARMAGSGDRYDRLRYGTAVKTASILLHLLTLCAVVILFVGMAAKADWLGVRMPAVFSMVGALGVALVAAGHAVAHYLSLRAPPKRGPPTGMENGLLAMLLVGAGAITALAALLAAGPATLPLAGRLTVLDAPFVLLAAAALANISLGVSRALPGIYGLFAGERDAYDSYLSRTKSVIMPAAVAFSLLFLVFILLLGVGAGFAGVVDDIPSDTVLLAVFGFIVAAMVASVVTSVVLSRKEDHKTLYHVKRTPEEKQSIAVLALSALVTSLLVGLAAWLATEHEALGLVPEQWVDVFAAALLAMLGPYGFLVAARHRRTRRMEERFPDFLRDIAASKAAGLTLTAAVQIAARGEYGALTPEIAKMSDQLAWNVPFEEALERFADRVRTPLVRRAVSLINEAGHSGGSVTDVLMAAAKDARELKNLEDERRGTMGLYTAIIYITFLVFLGVALVLYGTFIPEVLKTQAAGAGKGLGAVAGLGLGNLTLPEYRVFYFLAALVQGVGNGLVAGMMGTGKMLDGMRHGFVMVLIAWAAFASGLSL